MFDKQMNTVFLDLDGVIYDFGYRAKGLLGMTSKEYEDKFGSDVFWDDLKTKSGGRFFLNLPIFNEGIKLYWELKSQGFQITFLSGSPLSWGDQAHADKFNSIKRDFGPNQSVAICQSKNKYLYCSPDDILIDDNNYHRIITPWKNAGGIFIHYKDSKTTLNELEKLGI